MTAPQPSFVPMAHAGMPPLDESAEKLSFFEFWPRWLFYAPVIPWWIWFSLRYGGITLPLIANPGMPNGGFVGESKSASHGSFGPFARAALAPMVSVPGGNPDDRLACARSALKAAGLDYPLVAKPDIGCRGAGVRRINDEAALARYLEYFPPEADLILQELIAAPGEAGVYYCRMPGEAEGRVLSLTLKYFPEVVGDGQRTLAELIAADPRAGKLAHIYRARHRDRLDERIPAGETVRLSFSGSHSKGVIFRDGRVHITEALSRAIDRIARDIDGFYIGRFDIRFADFSAFLEGRDLRIVELNGAGGEMTHIWDSRTRLADAWRDLYRQFRLLFEIGRANRRRGVRPPKPLAFWRAWRAEEALVPTYPPTE